MRLRPRGSWSCGARDSWNRAMRCHCATWSIFSPTSEAASSPIARAGSGLRMNVTKQQQWRPPDANDADANHRVDFGKAGGAAVNRASCRQCGAEVIWAKHQETGKPAPLDASPWDGYGNIMI